MRRGVLYSLWLGVVILALLAGFIPEGWAGGGDEKARLLFTDLCSRITSLEARGIESKAQQAVWEETVRYLAERFGKGERKTLSSLPPSALKGKATWSTSTMVGKHKRDIRVIWDKEKGKLNIHISGDASGEELGKGGLPIGRYKIEIKAEVIRARDEKGNSIFRAQVPSEKMEGSLIVKVEGYHRDWKPKTPKVKAVERILRFKKRQVNASEYAQTLFINLCTQIPTTRLEIRDKLSRAVWEETIRYLFHRFGRKEQKPVVLLESTELKGEATWSTSTMVGKHIRDIKVTWDRERRKLYIDITGDAGGKELGKDKVPVNKYWEHLEVDVAVEEDEEGYLVLRPQLPKEDEVFISQKGEEVVCKAEGFKGFRGTVRGIWTSAVPAEGSPAFAGLKYKQVQTRRAFTG